MTHTFIYIYIHMHTHSHTKRQFFSQLHFVWSEGELGVVSVQICVVIVFCSMYSSEAMQLSYAMSYRSEILLC